MEAFSVQRLPVHEREGWLIAGKAVGAFSHFYDYLIFQVSSSKIQNSMGLMNCSRQLNAVIYKILESHINT